MGFHLASSALLPYHPASYTLKVCLFTPETRSGIGQHLNCNHSGDDIHDYANHAPAG
jgi:hypothetical protein